MKNFKDALEGMWIIPVLIVLLILSILGFQLLWDIAT